MSLVNKLTLLMAKMGCVGLRKSKTEDCVEGEFAGKHCKIDLINLKQNENLNEDIEAIKILDREEVL